MKDNDNVIDAFGEISERRMVTPSKNSLRLFMNDESRIVLYTAVAALVEGGMGLKEAALAVADEYELRKDEGKAQSTRMFFGGLLEDGADRKGLTQLVDEAFGKNFVKAEELALLRSLPAAKNHASVLRGAASVVWLQLHGSASGLPVLVSGGIR